MQPCRLGFQACCRGALLAQPRERVGARRRYVAMCRPAAKRRTSDRQLFAAEAQQRSRPAPSQVASPARCGGDCTARRWPRAALPAPPAPGEWAPAGKYTLADLVGWLSQAGNSTKFFALGANLCSRGAVRSGIKVFFDFCLSMIGLFCQRFPAARGTTILRVQLCQLQP